MNKAADQKKWPEAIRRGQNMLRAFAQEEGLGTERYAVQLKNLTVYYDRAGRLTEARDYIVAAYKLNTRHFGKAHFATSTSRNLYYKLSVTEKDYLTAIELMEESLHLASRMMDKQDRRNKQHFYLDQLISLYGLVGDVTAQTKALERYLALDEKLFGDHQTDSQHASWLLALLARNYCRLGKHKAFASFTSKHNLKLICLP